MLEETIRVKKKKSYGSVILVFLIFGVVGFFVWRVVYFSSQIRSGEVADLRLSAAKEMSVSRLAAAAASVEGATTIDIKNEPEFGNASAPLTVVVFADFSCIYSRESSFVMRSLAYQFSDSVHYIYKDFPLVDLHPDSELASEAAACANDQGKFWEMHDRLYMNQNDFSRDSFLAHARALDLDMGKFIPCFDKRKHATEIAADYDEGLKLGVYGTPTFFLNGQKIEGAVPADMMRGIFEKFKNQTVEN